MEGVAWTAVGLLAVAVFGSFGSFFYLGTRIDALGGDLGARMDALDARIDAQGGDLGARIDALSARIDSLGSRLDARIDGLTARMDEHLQRHAG